MSAYLSPVDYLLLILQGVLSLAVLALWRRLPFYSLRVWAGFSLLQVPAWWILAARETAEHYGDWFIRAGLVEGVILAVCAVEIGAAVLPQKRRMVWQLGPVCVALAIIAGVLLAERTALAVLSAGTKIAAGSSLGVLLVCLFAADPAGRFYGIGRALGIYLAGQLFAVHLPAWLNCDTPECLTGHSVAAWFARRTGPILWATGVAFMVYSSGNKDKE